ncbi:MAG: hypothetical protein IPL28_05975 [Chloroflexi bacterium]|nr:hypothetical protein [Chloroflexota bacterium]
MKIALIQTNWPGTREAMTATYRELVREAAERGAHLVCLQEFTLSPYFASVIDPANTMWAEPLHGGETSRILGEMARQNGVHLIGSIFEAGEDGRYWDTATIYNPAGGAGYTRKVHIPQGKATTKTTILAGGMASQYMRWRAGQRPCRPATTSGSPKWLVFVP